LFGLGGMMGDAMHRRADATSTLSAAGRGVAAIGLLLLAACGEALPPDAFGGAGPALAPERYFEGRTLSFGVFETASGAPTSRFSTASTGRREGDALLLDQTIRLGDGTVIERSWRLQRVSEHRYEATAGPVQGIALGEAHGRHFRWSYTIALPPGDWLHTVRFEHWMYLAEDGETLVNRFAVRKLGLVVSRATEVFRRLPPDGQ
jgi:Protein of unknown function (DUF3833)